MIVYQFLLPGCSPIQVSFCDFVLLFGLLLLSRSETVILFVFFVCFCCPAMSPKKNLISQLHTKKGTWKIVVRVTDLWEVRKQNSKQAIDMVLMDQMNLKIVDNQSEYKVSPIALLVYFVKTTSVKEINHPEIPPNVYMTTPFC
ncbi:hypothetical protein glysoja_047835 [Glycine soja]|uniref:DUF223 domain-containing protein n=2 Tax=Glycine soja TaxID=3848 RepID=A0A0B2P2R0_GLYSO|nr:hypothetical protein JHK86_055630 [Glycine max]KHN01754.1 hypothetical protein glysoja_047835 [Glycine soja]